MHLHIRIGSSLVFFCEKVYQNLGGTPDQGGFCLIMFVYLGWREGTAAGTGAKHLASSCRYLGFCTSC